MTQIVRFLSFKTSSRAPNSLENSFRTLATFDENRDGAIDRSDAVYTRLRLWTDLNHDGVSQPSELVSLSPSGIERIGLAYQPVGRRDGQRNYYRYRGSVSLKNGRQLPLWDVFLDMQPGTGSLDSAVDADPAMAELLSTEGWREQTSVSIDLSAGVQDARPTPPVALGPLGGTSATIFEQSEPADTDFESMSLSEVPVLSSVEPAAPPPPPPAGELVEYYHLDALGSVRLVTDETGAVLRHHDYLPFGEEWQPEIGSPDKRLFTGKERDVETGLDYFGARYYQSQTGRFTSPDIPGLDQSPFDSQSWNLHSYVRNNPLRYLDPTGRQCKNGYNPKTGAFCTETIGEDPYRRAKEAWLAMQRFFRDSWLNFERQSPRTAGFVAGSTQAVTTLFTSPRQSCLGQVAINTIENVLPVKPGVADLAAPVGAGAALYQRNRALQYAALRPNYLGGQGLIYPNRSSVFRGMMNQSKWISRKGVPVASEVLAIGEAIRQEQAAWQAGTCR